MNYQRIYNSIISRARTRVLEGYTEQHHVLPRCLGGSDNASNLVRLTPEEHYLCHLILVKIYPKESKLVFSARMMCVSNKDVKRNNKFYGWLRRKFVEEMTRFKNTPEQKSLISKTWKQIYADTPELKELISERMKKDNPMKRDGVAQRVAETRRQKGNLGRGNTPLSEEERAAISERMKKNNPCAGIPPWRSPKATAQSIGVWRDADTYYQWWCANKKGYCSMATAFGFKDWLASHASMVKRFKSGWIPKEDPDWLSWLV
ncbi:homing endonuclease [Dickeya phage Ds25CZ]|uniref:Homing endonuclease n=1 Tax=Dickeya phage Ds25CZ TaxID=2686434 RepID=A0A7L4YG61_9CAUD|nr:homing endonuclease [Dickeya phage Ds25CZ]